MSGTGRRRSAQSAAFLAIWIGALGLGGRGGSLAASPRDPAKIPRKSILVTTSLDAGDGLSATLTEFFSGERSEKSGINLLLGLYSVERGERTLIATRDYNLEGGGYVSRGSLEVTDLDRDGTAEIMISYHHREEPGAMRVTLDLFKIVEGKLHLAWSGPVRIDTTNPTLTLPGPDRERYVREIDYPKTALGLGRKVCFQKTVSVAAGIKLDPSRVLAEEFDLSSTPAAPRSSNVPDR